MESEQHGEYSHLVSTAISLFKEYGYSNVSVNQICNAAGIGRSSFYSRYSSKDDLILHLYSEEFVKDEELLDRFVLVENDFERIWMLYDYFVSLAQSVGPVVSASLMIIELNQNVGIYDRMMHIRKWSVPLCINCQKLGIFRNQAPAQELVPAVSAALNNHVFEWCRQKGEFSLRQTARNTLEILFDVAPEYRKAVGE